MMNRRHFCFSIGASSLLLPSQGHASTDNAVMQLRAIEQNAKGRLGVFILDTRNGRSVGWRVNERFCHCSTYKLSLSAMVFRESDAGRLNLMEMIPFKDTDIAAYSPIVKKYLSQGRLSVFFLTYAMQVASDNTAANLLMRRLGGPNALTHFWRNLGDDVSVINDYEPSVNVIPPQTIHNSTTPKAMAHTLEKIIFSDFLSSKSRHQLCDWMYVSQSGLHRIRAGIPHNWKGLDKTGSGMRAGLGNKTNDLAILFPPQDENPLIVTGYFENPLFSNSVSEKDESVLRMVGHTAVSWHS